MAVPLPPLIGMIHLAPLPGAPGYQGSMDRIIDMALGDAQTLEDAGFEAVMVENFGDAPFWAEGVPAVTTASMARIVAEIVRRSDLKVGVNVLRNDALSALAVAAATGATMIRVNVLTGTMFTDQGQITGRAAEVARTRAHLAPEVAIYADVFVKHATPPPGLTLEQSAIDTWERGGADALIISGTGTGRPIDIGAAQSLRTAVPEAPLIAGSGATIQTLAQLAQVVDSVIVGTDLKIGSIPAAAVDPDKAKRFIEEARRIGFM